MICTACPSPDWQSLFLRMLPAIRKHAHIAFRLYDREYRDELVQAVLCNVCCALARLAELDRLDLAYASVLARYGVAQVRAGRMTGGSLNFNDITSCYCQRMKDVALERLDKYNDEEEAWEEVLVPDDTCSPAELAASRIDFPAWLRTLSRRDRQLARFLAVGNRTREAAMQVRHERGYFISAPPQLQESWREFTGESDFNTAA